VLTDTRLVRLVRGTTFDQPIAWVDVVQGTHAESGATGGTSGTSSFGRGICT
jgi:hypothetical protein